MTSDGFGTLEMRSFAERGALAEALADHVAGMLRAGLDKRGAASLAVSGGSTPKRFFAALAGRNLDWLHVTVTLVDERWVPEENERSNVRLVREHLLRDRAAAARFLPLVTVADTPEAGLPDVVERLADLPRPFDAVVLGMGEDGHTASFFPGGDNLALALAAKPSPLPLAGRGWGRGDAAAHLARMAAGPKPSPTKGEGARSKDSALLLPMRAPNVPEPRVTFALAPLLETRALYLHIEGEAKRRVLEAALRAGSVEDMPVRAVLRQTQTPVEVFWAP